MVRHLEHRLQYRSILRIGYEHLDTVEGHLHEASQEDLCQIVGHDRHGGEVQAEGMQSYKLAIRSVLS